MVKSEYMRPDYRVFLPVKLFTTHILLFTDTLFHVEHKHTTSVQASLFHVEHSRVGKIFARTANSKYRVGTACPPYRCSH